MPKFLEVTNKQAARDAIEASGQLYVNVKDYGAVGDGVTDDTAAIEAAFAVNGGIYFPPGTYNYTGTGLTGTANPTIVGAGRNETVIDLEGGDYLLDINSQINRLDVRDLSFYRGKGAIRHTWASANVTYKHAVQRCNFHEYTECAIASDSADMPYWSITDCLFDGVNTTGTIGVALGGGTDEVVITRCSFIRNRVHITASMGNSMIINDCSFVQMSTVATSGPRSAIWIRPGVSTSNSGPGLVISGCKFGNENLLAGDHRILYADQQAGTNNGVRFPELGADSTGYIVGHRITDCIFMNISSGDNAVVYSTTPNVRGLAITDCWDDGSQYLLEFRTPPSVPNAANTINLFGPILGPGISPTSNITRISNAVGVGYVDDPAETIQDTAALRGYGTTAKYENLLYTHQADDFVALGSATVTGETDVIGGSNAALYSFNAGSHVTQSVSAMTPDVPVCIEFDLKNADDGSELSEISVWLWNLNSNYHWARRVEVPSAAQGWTTYRFHFVPRTAGSILRLAFGPPPNDPAGTVIVGRPRVYHGDAYQIGGQRPTSAAAATTVMGSADLANDVRNKLIALGIVSGTPSTGSVTDLGTVTTLELGHASDSTISRLSAGQLAVEGNPLGTKVAVPASASATGVPGQWAAEAGYLYICVATDTWERVAIASW